MLDEEMLTYYLDLMRSIGVQVIELEEHDGWLFRQTMDEGRRIQRMFLWKEGTEWRMDYSFPPVGCSCYFATQQLELMLKEIITGWYFLRNWNPTLPDTRFYSKTEVDLSGWTIRELEGPWKTLVTPDGEELPIRHLSSSVDSMEGLCRVFPLSISEILVSCDDYYARPLLQKEGEKSKRSGPPLLLPRRRSKSVWVQPDGCTHTRSMTFSSEFSGYVRSED